jgi:hypothetical protein
VNGDPVLVGLRTPSRQRRASSATRRPRPRISISPSEGDQGATSTLYVDPQSYQPIRFTQANTPVAINWLPATPANIAKAEPVQIRPGFRQVSSAQFNKTADENSALLKSGG